MDGQQSGCTMLGYHDAWLQHMEQGWLAWDEDIAKLKLWHVLVWNHGMPSTAPSQAYTAPSQAYTAPSQLASSHQPRKTSIRVMPAPPQFQTQQAQRPYHQRSAPGFLLPCLPAASVTVEMEGSTLRAWDSSPTSLLSHHIFCPDLSQTVCCQL